MTKCSGFGRGQSATLVRQPGQRERRQLQLKIITSTAVDADSYAIMKRHILITGAAGSGTTSVARFLAKKLHILHLEADDYFWLPSEPPYQHRVTTEHRCQNLVKDISAVNSVVVAGSVMGWGQALEDMFDLVVFLYVPADLRMARLERREIERFGSANPEFLRWAADYDNGSSAGRSLSRHQAWLSGRTCPVLKLEGDMSVEVRVARVLEMTEVIVNGGQKKS
jgi:adenylate kinase family enzyme